MLCRKLGEPRALKAPEPTFIHYERLAQDQTEINRKIAEASKGSKFYEASILYCSCTVLLVY